MSHKLPVRLEDLERRVQDGDHELPQLSARRLRDGNVSQITEYVVNLLAFSDELVHRQHAIFNNHLVNRLFGSYNNVGLIKCFDILKSEGSSGPDLFDSRTSGSCIE